MTVVLMVMTAMVGEIVSVIAIHHRNIHTLPPAITVLRQITTLPPRLPVLCREAAPNLLLPVNVLQDSTG